jgi:DNA ligase-1
VKIEDIQTKVCLYVFDILFLNDQTLLKKNFIERRDILHKKFPVVDNKFTFAKSKDAEQFEEIEVFLQDSIKDCCEGLMVKTLDVNATYEPSKRSFNWLKLKKDYLDTELGDSVDLIPVGADFGVGKRTGYFGSFLLACYDEDTETYQTVCKIGTGFSEEALKEIHDKLKDRVMDNAPKGLKHKGKNIDVWFDPCQVWEVKAADLSISPIYCCAIGEADKEKVT